MPPVVIDLSQTDDERDVVHRVVEALTEGRDEEPVSAIRMPCLIVAADMQSDEGGLAANTRIPFADLLSSCTGLITLADLNATDRLNIDAIRKYALSMQAPEGGFTGFALDQTADVEYTFYGLATLALCELA